MNAPANPIPKYHVARGKAHYNLSMEDLIHQIEDIIRFIGVLFDVLGVIVIILGFAWAGWLYFTRDDHDPERHFRRLRARIGQTLLLTLEILVAADIIRTVAIEVTVDNLVALGLLVLIRTFLSWSLEVEVEGHFPWQSKPKNETS